MLEFNIRNQEISRIDSFSPAEKSVNYLVAHFDFKTDDWNSDVVKRAVFRNVKSKVEKDAILEDDSCIVPWEVLVGSGEIEVSVHGTIREVEISTNVAKFNLDRTLDGGSASQEPSPTVYEQILKEVQETKDIAQSVRDDADAGKFDGKDGKDGKDGESGTGEIDEEQFLQFAIKTTTDKATFHHITDSADYRVLDFGMEGKTEQESTKGYQLFNINGDINRTYQGNVSSVISNTVENNILTTTGENALSKAFGQCFTNLKGKTITISAKMVSMGTNTNLALMTLLEDGVFNQNILFESVNTTKLLVYTVTSDNFVIIFANGNGTNAQFSEIKVYEGSYTTSNIPEWEPFTGNQPSPNPVYQQEIRNAGVLNEKTGRYEHKCCVGNKNWYTGGDVSGKSNVTITDFKPIPAGTYVFSADVESTDTDSIYRRVYVYFADGTSRVVDMPSGVRSVADASIVASSEIVKMLFRASTTDAYSANDTFSYKNIQIELLEATDYTPHQSQQFTLTSPVPITKWDKLVKRDGVWGWSIFSLKILLDGGESDWYASDSRYGFTVGGCLPVSIPYRIGYCNQATYFNANYGISHQTCVSNSFCCGGGSPDNTLHFYKSSLYDSSLEDRGLANWKAHLAEKPLEIITYADEEQSFIPLPDEEQELLHNLETYYGVTNVYNEQGCPMWLEYVNDTKLYVDNQLLEIKKAMI